MKQLVVNGDDFGLTESVNQGVIEAYRCGILTSTTILANGDAFDTAAKLARSEPGLGVGVHLNLTEGRPVSDIQAVASLVDSRGYFFGTPGELARRVLLGKLHRCEVETEWSAQIEKARSARVTITHLDGHKHVHMLAGLFPVALRLAARYAIQGVRLAIERPVGFGALLRRNARAASKIAKQYVQGRILALVALDYRERLEASSLASPRYFFGITQTGFLDGPALEAILWNLPDGTSELMCHPGYADGALQRTGTRLIAQREQELVALTRPETRKLVRRLGIQLIDYRGLRTN